MGQKCNQQNVVIDHRGLPYPNLITHLVAPRQEEVVKVLLPVKAAQAEVEALPVGAVELPLERDRVVVGPDPLVHREVLEHLDAGDHLPDHLDEEGLVTEDLGHDSVEKKASVWNLK